jgi:hypothetical protein
MKSSKTIEPQTSPPCPEIPPEFANLEAFLPECPSPIADYDEFDPSNEMTDLHEIEVPEEFLSTPSDEDIVPPSPSLSDYFAAYDRAQFEDEMYKKQEEEEYRRSGAYDPDDGYRFYSDCNGSPADTGPDDGREYARNYYEGFLCDVSCWLECLWS